MGTDAKVTGREKELRNKYVCAMDAACDALLAKMQPRQEDNKYATLSIGEILSSMAFLHECIYGKRQEVQNG